MTEMGSAVLKFLGLLFILSACVQDPIREFSELKPTVSGFEATLGVNDNRSPVNNVEAEARRLKSLQEWTTDEGICPNGYEIYERTVIRRLGYEYWILYRGKCL